MKKINHYKCVVCDVKWVWYTCYKRKSEMDTNLHHLLVHHCSGSHLNLVYLPPDTHSRVILKSHDEEDFLSTYINANYLKVGVCVCECACMHACLCHEVIIVMVTASLRLQ